MDFSLLTKRQVNNLQVFKDYGKAASITDYATSLGGKNIDGIGAYYLQKPIICQFTNEYLNTYVDFDGTVDIHLNYYLLK